MPVLPKDCLPSRSVIGETSYDNIPFPFATGVGHLQATAPCISLDSRHLAVEHPLVFEVSACLPRSYIRLRGVCAIFLCMDSKRKLLCRGVPHESQKNSFVSSHSFACRLFSLLLQRQQNAVHHQLHWRRQRYSEPDSCRCAFHTSTWHLDTFVCLDPQLRPADAVSRQCCEHSAECHHLHCRFDAPSERLRVPRTSPRQRPSGHLQQNHCRCDKRCRHLLHRLGRNTRLRLRQHQASFADRCQHAFDFVFLGDANIRRE